MLLPIPAEEQALVVTWYRVFLQLVCLRWSCYLFLWTGFVVGFKDIIELYKKLWSCSTNIGGFYVESENIFRGCLVLVQTCKGLKSLRSFSEYKPPYYKVGSKLMHWQNVFRKYARSQQSENIGAKWSGPFEVRMEIRKNVVWLDLPNYLKFHHVVHLSHTASFVELPEDAGRIISEKPAAILADEGGEHIVEKILAHRRRGRSYQLFTLMWEDPTHEAVWKPSNAFINTGGTFTEIWLNYVPDQSFVP